MIRPATTRLFLIVALLAAASSGPQARAAIQVPLSYFGPNASVITFENPNKNTGLPTIPGVNFEQFYGNPAYKDFEGSATFTGYPANQFFGDQYFGNAEGGGLTTGYSKLGIDFATPQAAVGAYVNQLSGQSVGAIVTTVYNAAGAVIGQASTTFPSTTFPNATSPVFVGFADASGIARITWTTTIPNFFGVDNVIYQAAAVPEPASVVMLGGGVVALGMLSLRRKRA